jgi:hypothetical protein
MLIGKSTNHHQTPRTIHYVTLISDDDLCEARSINIGHRVNPLLACSSINHARSAELHFHQSHQSTPKFQVSYLIMFYSRSEKIAPMSELSDTLTNSPSSICSSEDLIENLIEKPAQSSSSGSIFLTRDTDEIDTLNSRIDAQAYWENFTFLSSSCDKKSTLQQEGFSVLQSTTALVFKSKYSSSSTTGNNSSGKSMMSVSSSTSSGKGSPCGKGPMLTERSSEQRAFNPFFSPNASRSGSPSKHAKKFMTKMIKGGKHYAQSAVVAVMAS